MVSKDLEKDLNLLEKYKDGGDLDPEDIEAVNILCSIGLMNRGISLKRKVVTAKTTGTGLGLIGKKPNTF